MRRRRPLMSLVAGLGLGLLASLLAIGRSPSDRIVVGGTGNTLSVVLLLNGKEIVIGGGSVPNDAVDLADRSTLPWQRPYELLLVPAWDTVHLPGALSLVERGAVRSVAVLGAPGNEPAWTILERQARRSGSEFKVVTQPAVVPLGPDAALELRPTPTGAFVCLRTGTVRVSIVDAVANPLTADPCGRPTAAIALRASAGRVAPLVVRPKPRRAEEFAQTGTFEIQLARGERAEIRLAGDEFRVRRSSLVNPPTSRPSAPRAAAAGQGHARHPGLRPASIPLVASAGDARAAGRATCRSGAAHRA